jgi:hypothetical protein
MIRAPLDLLSTHGLALLVLAQRPDLRIRDVAAALGVTERASQGIVNDLVDAGYLERIREGRRNRYVARGDRPLARPAAGARDAADLLRPLVSDLAVVPSRADCRAVVLGCSDYRYQEPMRALLAMEGLIEKAETILLPGGASALAGRDGGRILAGLEFACRTLQPPRLLLLAHHGCAVPGAFVAGRRDPISVRRAVTERRQRVAGAVVRRTGLVPELWFLDDRGARRVPVGLTGPADPASANEPAPIGEDIQLIEPAADTDAVDVRPDPMPATTGR